MEENTNQINLEENKPYNAPHYPLSLEGHWQPWYDDRRDYNTNAPSYYDYLSNFNHLIKSFVELLNRSARRNVQVEDTNSIDLTKINDWIDEGVNSNTWHDEIILKADVILSTYQKALQFNKNSYNIQNAIECLPSGLFAPNYLPLLENLLEAHDDHEDRLVIIENKAFNAQKVFAYDTIDQMKASPIIPGYVAIVKGEWIFEARSNVTVDDVTVFEGSYAGRAWVLTGETVNPRMLLQAYSKYYGNHSESIQDVVNALENKIFKAGELVSGDIELDGKWVLQKPIRLSPYLTYKLKGDVFILDNVTNEEYTGSPLVTISYDERTLKDTNVVNRATSWTRGDIFVGGNLNITNTTSTINGLCSIGLQIGNKGNTVATTHAFARGTMKNVTVTYFNIGVKIYPVHYYIYNIVGFNLFNNTTNLVVGDFGDSNIDSGEKLSFSDCLFGSSQRGIDINVATLRFEFNNCSWDYNSDGCIYFRKQSHININYAHIEDCGAGSEATALFSGYQKPYVFINFEKVRLFNAHKIVKLVEGVNFTCTLNDFSESNLSVDNADTSETFYIFDNNVLVPEVIENRSALRMTNERQNELKFNLQEEPIAELTAQAKGNKVKYAYADSNSKIYISDWLGEKLIKFEAIDSSKGFQAQIAFDEMIPIKQIDKEVTLQYLYRIAQGGARPVLRVSYYDKDGNYMSSSEWSGTEEINRLKAGDEWKRPVNLAHKQKTPKGAVSIKVNYIVFADPGTGSVYIKQPHVEFH